MKYRIAKIIKHLEIGSELKLSPSEANMEATCLVCGNYDHKFGEFLVAGNNGMIQIRRIR